MKELVTRVVSSSGDRPVPSLSAKLVCHLWPNSQILAAAKKSQAKYRKHDGLADPTRSLVAALLRHTAALCQR